MTAASATPLAVDLGCLACGESDARTAFGCAYCEACSEERMEAVTLAYLEEMTDG